MRRRHLTFAAAAAVLAASTLAACDTGDGREMKPPTAAQRQELETTTTTTASTTVPLITQQTFPPPTVGPVDDPADSGGASAGVSGGLTAPWRPGTMIDVAYTCDGAGDQPLISWSAPGDGAVELALTIVDTSTTEPYVHWAVFGLPPAAGEIGGGSLPQGAVEATNSDGTIGWVPFCPPAGDTHIYVVTVYLLEQQLALPAEADPTDLLAAIQLASYDSHVITGLATGAPPTS